MKKAFILWLALFFIISASGVSATEQLVSTNLGSDSYSASSTLKESNAPEFAFGGNFKRKWRSEKGAPAWIEVDLGKNYILSRIKLYVRQSPLGENTHEIWVSSNPIKNDRTNAKLVKTVQGDTKMRDYCLRIKLPVNGRYVQVHTTRSSGPVEWYEIRVFATK